MRKSIAVISGKGGVGKSTVAVNLAAGISGMGFSTGLLDIDIHGPSVPSMLSLEGRSVQSDGKMMIPITYGSMQVMSIGFMLPNRDDAVIWRGPLKMQVIEQMIHHTAWGDLDYLIIDAPPGTGDEPLSMCQLIQDLSGMLIVTTPQKISEIDVRKSVTFCRKLTVPAIGLIENMRNCLCPHCGKEIELFPDGGAQRISREMHIPLLGSLPFEPAVGIFSDQGIPIIESSSPVSKMFENIIKKIMEAV